MSKRYLLKYSGRSLGRFSLLTLKSVFTMPTKIKQQEKPITKQLRVEVLRVYSLQAKSAWFWFRVVGANGEKICHSENYTTKTKALKSARLLNLPIVDKT